MKLPKLKLDKLKIKFFIIFSIAYIGLFVLAMIQIITEIFKNIKCKRKINTPY